MNVFEAVKQSVTTRQAAEHYGIHVGRNGMACCPFHHDKTPSMKLDRRYHCFGCGADGDVIDFTAALYGLGKKEAAVQLAQDFGLSYEDWKPPGKAKKPKPRQKSPEEQFQEAKNRCFRILADYLHLLMAWRKEYAPHSRRKPFIPGLWKPWIRAISAMRRTRRKVWCSGNCWTKSCGTYLTALRTKGSLKKTSTSPSGSIIPNTGGQGRADVRPPKPPAVQPRPKRPQDDLGPCWPEAVKEVYPNGLCASTKRPFQN